MPTQRTKNNQIVNCFSWNEGQIRFDSNLYSWDDVCIAEEILAAVDGGGAIACDWLGAYEKLPVGKKKRFIDLVCKVKNEEPTNYRTEIKEVKLSIKDIQLTVSSILGITIEMEKQIVL